MARGGHGGHHGGSWKVAYADFVTSMMALFLVLWLVSADQEIRQAVQDYFSGALKKPGGTGTMKMSPSGPKMHQKQGLSDQELLQLQQLQRTSEKLQEALKNSDKEGEDLIRFEFLADGVRIVALDKSKRPFFKPGTAELTDFGNFVLRTIAWEVERYPFFVEVEGHTQKAGEGQMTEEDNWNLSTYRAISAQNSLTENGVTPSKFFRVAGYADRMPVTPEKPNDEENRRIAIIIRPKMDQDMFDFSSHPRKSIFE
ncbi:MAG: flagellar motor protein MotB [Verrucomicrobiota bacterium]